MLTWQVLAMPAASSSCKSRGSTSPLMRSTIQDLPKCFCMLLNFNNLDCTEDGKKLSSIFKYYCTQDDREISSLVMRSLDLPF